MSARHEIALMGALMVTATLVVGQLYLTIPLAGAIAEVFGVSQAAAAWAGTAFGLAYAMGGLVWGTLSDRFGRRRVLLFGLITLALATGLLVVENRYPVFLAGRAAQGFLAASFPAIALSIVGELLPPQRRQLGVALMSLCFLSAAPTAQLIGGTIQAPPAAFMAGAAPLYLAMAAVLLALLPARTAPDEGVAGVTFRQAISELTSKPVVVACWAVAPTTLFAFVIFQSATEMGVGLEANRQLVRAAGLPPLILCLLAAPMSQRIGAVSTARIGLTLAAIGLGLTIAPGPTDVAAAVALSGGIALGVPGLIGAVSQQAALHNRGMALSVYTFVLFIGASVASPVATALGQIGAAAIYGVPAALLLAGVAALTVAGRRATA